MLILGTLGLGIYSVLQVADADSVMLYAILVIAGSLVLGVLLAAPTRAIGQYDACLSAVNAGAAAKLIATPLVSPSNVFLIFASVWLVLVG